jgi:hypothetical protein
MPNAIASAVETTWMPASSWLTIFIAEPGPALSPSSKTVSAMASSAARARSNDSALPAAMMESLPSAARADPPEIGASR